MLEPLLPTGRRVRREAYSDVEITGLSRCAQESTRHRRAWLRLRAGLARRVLESLCPFSALSQETKHSPVIIAEIYVD